MLDKRFASHEGRNRDHQLRVRTVNGDGLIAVRKVLHDAASDIVERSTKENVVGGFANDVNL